MKLQIKRPSTSKPIESWSNKDFVIYYCQKYKELSGTNFEIPPVAWAGFMSRIKGFREKMHLSPEKYKEFVDKVFSVFFTQKDRVPAFGAIASEHVYHIVKSCRKPLTEFTNDDFVHLRNQLYANSNFFNSLL